MRRLGRGQVSSQAPGWWLDIDLDVLDRHEFSACGWSVAVYNPDLDPGRRAAARIVNFTADVISGRMQEKRLDCGENRAQMHLIKPRPIRTTPARPCY